MKTKLYILPKVGDTSLVFLASLATGAHDIGDTLFTSAMPKGFSISAFEFVDTLDAADYALFPHALKSKHDPLYPHVEEAKRVAKVAGKSLVVFVGGDLSHDIFVDDCIVLKGSQYKRLKRSNEIIVPPSCEDFAESLVITPRHKSERPVISFCGWAGFASSVAYAKYLVRNVLVSTRALLSFDRTLVVYKKGLYWRRKALRTLAHDARVKTAFIVRTSFSANKKTISLDPGIARREYVENMYASDFVLAPKGDGNFSVRFYEALSMGRIPILIDTDCVLPFEEFIDYSKCILRVSYKDIPRLGEIVSSFYATIPDAEWIAMQERAREVFVQTLRYDAFLNTLFTKVLPPTRPLSGEAETTAE